MVRETALTFPCQGETLFGVLAEAEEPSRLAVIVVVGGPQTRVGSHRQFALLSRALAKAGFPCLRFDFRGMGDSTGEQRDFENVSADIAAAVDAMYEHSHRLDGVVLWGLCDGASAACFYAPIDPRVRGLVLLNPWVRTEAGEARTYLRHYYLKRLLNPSFWKKLLRGGVGIRDSIGGVATTAKASRQATRRDDSMSLPDRMADALKRWGGPFALLLSGNDYTAREFESVYAENPAWQALAAQTPPVGVQRFEAADHTFSRAEWRDEVAVATIAWLRARLTA